MLRAALLWLALAGAAFAGAIPAGFNDEGIEWLALDEGLARARADGKPVLLVVHATWCPRCREYRAQFFDERVTAHGGDVVFVLVDQDREPRAASRYAPDGNYIPRTMVLAPGGGIVKKINAHRDDYRYFISPRQPGDLLRYLDAARGVK